MISVFQESIDKMSNKKTSRDIINSQVFIINQILANQSAKEKAKILKIGVSNLIESIKKRDYKKSFGYAHFIFFSNFDGVLDEIKKQGAF
ncbi:TPA: hypothetical protein LZ355_001979, partial [Enterobacter asburiae]|nr:hypothetical protein [Enterobacter asburiae]